MFSLTQKMVGLTWSSEHPCDTQASEQKQQHRLAAGESNLLLPQFHPHRKPSSDPRHRVTCFPVGYVNNIRESHNLCESERMIISTGPFSHSYCSEAQSSWDEKQRPAEGGPGSKSKVKTMAHDPQP